MVPALKVLPEGGATVQVTAVVAVPEMEATNCTWVPMMAVLGVTVMGGIV
jgi:hypothetical protein